MPFMDMYEDRQLMQLVYDIEVSLDTLLRCIDSMIELLSEAVRKRG